MVLGTGGAVSHLGSRTVTTPPLLPRCDEEPVTQLSPVQTPVIWSTYPVVSQQYFLLERLSTLLSMTILS